MSDPYAETDEWPTPSLAARPATRGPEQPEDRSTVTGDAEGAREARYASELLRRVGEGASIPEAAMAVADEEQAALRAERDRLKRGGAELGRILERTLNDEVERLRGGIRALADDWDQFTDADWFDHTPREHADVLRALLSGEPEECPYCEGRGIVDSAEHRCGWCGGTGRALLSPSPAATTDEADPRPCRGRNSNVCVAEGCYGEACIAGGGS